MPKKEKAKREKSSFNFKKYLKQWGKAKKTAAESPSGEFSDLEDGVYIGRLTDARVGPSSKGNEGVLLEFTVIKGDDKGRKQFHWIPLDGEQKNFDRLAKVMRSLGSDGDIEEIESDLKTLVKDKTCVRFKLRTSEATDEFPDPRQWFNILKVVEVDEDDEDDEDNSSSKKSKKDDEDEDEEADSEDEDADGDEDDEEEADEISKGDTVEFKVGKKTKQGVVKKIKGDEAKVETDDEIVEIDVSELTKVDADGDEDDEEEEDEDDKKSKKKSSKEDDEDEDEAVEPEKGQSVVFKKGKKEIEGVIKKVDADDEKVTVKTEDGEKVVLGFDEIEIIASSDDDDE